VSRRVNLASAQTSSAFTCTASVDHDDHGASEDEDHDHHGAQEVVVTTNGVAWDCDEQESAAEDEHHGSSNAEVWGYSMLSVFIASAGAVLCIVWIFPWLPSVRKYVDDMAALSAGTLLGASFLHMLPEAGGMVRVA
jgi:hypothetical protein